MRSISTQSLKVPRTARYAFLGDRSELPQELWIVLHGYGELCDAFLGNFRELDDGRRWLVAPEGLSRFYLKSGGGPVGASWMTREAREEEIADYLAYLDQLAGSLFEELKGADPGVTLLGFSQGTATACRWALHTSMHIDRLVLWGGGVPPEVESKAALGKLRNTQVLTVVGDRDAYVDGERREREEARLRREGWSFRSLSFQGGHRLDRDLLAQLAALGSRPADGEP